jgi:nitric oxide reductase activation protein
VGLGQSTAVLDDVAKAPEIRPLDREINNSPKVNHFVKAGNERVKRVRKGSKLVLKGVVALRQIAMEFPQCNRRSRDYVTRHISDGHVVCHDNAANSPHAHSRMCFLIYLNVRQSERDFLNARSRIASPVSRFLRQQAELQQPSRIKT